MFYDKTKGLFTWREDVPSTRKMLEGGSSWTSCIVPEVRVVYCDMSTDGGEIPAVSVISFIQRNILDFCSLLQTNKFCEACIIFWYASQKPASLQ